MANKKFGLNMDNCDAKISVEIFEKNPQNLNGDNCDTKISVEAREKNPRTLNAGNLIGLEADAGTSINAVMKRKGVGMEAKIKSNYKSSEVLSCVYTTKSKWERLREKKTNRFELPTTPFLSLNKYYPDVQPDSECVPYGLTLPSWKQDVYKMPSSRRGVVVIINMNTFDVTTGLEPRAGTNKDAKDVGKVFSELGFEIHEYTDVRKNALISILRDTAKTYSSYSCFVCVILSHGFEGYICAYDGCIHLSDIFSSVDTPYLVGKPKLFFIQACRKQINVSTNANQKTADNLSRIPEQSGLSSLDNKNNDNSNSASLSEPRPAEMLLSRQKDFLYSFATQRGDSSWRHPESGSIYIQNLCKTFRTHAHKENLQDMLYKLNRSMLNDGVNSKEQQTSTVPHLTKLLYFFDPVQVYTDSGKILVGRETLV